MPDGGAWEGGLVPCAPDASAPDASAADAAPPVVLECPARVDLGCVGETGRRAFYPAPRATCGGAPVEVRCDPPSGAVFPPGDTRVRCTAAGAACDFVVSAGASGAARLRCVERVEVACAGPLTPAQLPTPPTDTACGAGPAGSITHDAPAAGLPPGATDVRFRLGSGPACITRVEVADRDPPPLDCTVIPTGVRATRGAPAPVPVPAVTDRCGVAVSVTAEPATTTARGAIAATFTAVNASGHRASCAGMANVRNAFAAPGLRVAHAAIDGDRTAVTLVWDHAPDSDATQYRVERAERATGPWTMVGATDAPATRFDDPALPGAQAFYRVTSLVDGIAGGTTEPVRALAVAAASYDLGVQPVPGLEVPANAAAGTPATTSAPLRAVVRHPRDLAAGPFPLVLLLHGNHGNCRLATYDASGSNPNRDDACVTTNDGRCRVGTPAPNAEGLAYLAETLAAHGYVVASVDANALNCREFQVGARVEAFISHRARLLLEHARRWRAWSAAGGAAPFGATFAGRVDTARVGLFGHSRGAEAVAAVPALAAAAPDLAGVAFGAVFALAPTNFDNPQPGGVPFATLVPVCDGDVFTYNGVQLYDRATRTDGAAPAVQLFAARANHNFFNTEWRFDDNRWGVPSCEAAAVFEPPVPRRMLEPTVAAWFDGTLAAGAAGPAAALEPWLRAAGDVPPGLELYTAADEPLDVRRSYASPRRARVDDFEDADPARNLLGGAYAASGGFAGPAVRPLVCTGASSPACDRTYTVSFPQGALRFGWPHQNPFGPPPERAALAFDWTSADAVLTAELGASPASAFDASGYRVLSLRLASRASALNTARATQDLEVRLVDAAGRRAAARVSEVVTVPHLYPSGYPRAVLQTARVALAGLAARSTPPVDLRQLTRIELALPTGSPAQGSLLVSDIEFAE